MITKFLFLCAVAFSQALQLHHHMTEDEIQTIFQTSRHAVPEYEVVPLYHTLNGENTDAYEVVKLNAFGNDVELNLKPNEGILYGINTPVIVAVPDRNQPRGVKFSKVPNPFKEVGIPHQDEQTNSAVILTKNDDGSVHMSGNILDKYVIQPAPERLANLTRKARSINETYDSLEQTHHHIIFKQPHPTREEIQRGMRLVESQNALRRHKENNPTGGRQKRNATSIAYPEILVAMDYSLYRTQKSDLKTALTYLLAFWNAVDLRYRTLPEPRIQLNIAGFVISIQEGASPFIEKSRRRGNLVNAEVILKHMNTYFYPDGQIPAHWDITIAMTKMKLYDKEGGKGLLGYAHVESACAVYSFSKTTLAVGVIEDNGAYSGIQTGAHELGHLFGATHDGEHCGMNEGFVMAPFSGSFKNSYYWSECSIRAISTFINSEAAQCLYNVPNPGTPLQRVLPGKLISLDEQCRAITGKPFCRHLQPSSKTCLQLWCSSQGDSCLSYGAAAEGSLCGTNKFCIRGECVPDNSSEPVAPPEIVIEKLPSPTSNIPPTSDQQNPELSFGQNSPPVVNSKRRAPLNRYRPPSIQDPTLEIIKVPPGFLEYLYSFGNNGRARFAYN